jgi:hypothetical protein
MAMVRAQVHQFSEKTSKRNGLSSPSRSIEWYSLSSFFSVP